MAQEPTLPSLEINIASRLNKSFRSVMRGFQLPCSSLLYQSRGLIKREKGGKMGKEPHRKQFCFYKKRLTPGPPKSTLCPVVQ